MKKLPTVTYPCKEEDDSKAFAAWLKTARGVIKYTHVANENPNKILRFKNGAMGLHKGVPDFIVVTHSRVMWIEMKRKSKYAVSKDQTSWIDALQAAGQIAMVCHGVYEAVAAVQIVVKGGMVGQDSSKKTIMGTVQG